MSNSKPPIDPNLSPETQAELAAHVAKAQADLTPLALKAAQALTAFEGLVWKAASTLVQTEEEGNKLATAREAVFEYMTKPILVATTSDEAEVLSLRETCKRQQEEIVSLRAAGKVVASLAATVFEENGQVTVVTVSGRTYTPIVAGDTMATVVEGMIKNINAAKGRL